MTLWVRRRFVAGVASAALLLAAAFLTAPAAGASAARPTYTVQGIPSASGFSATCPAAGVCYGVGYSGSPRYDTTQTPLVEVLRAGSWTSVPLAGTAAGHGAGIACSGVGECAALIAPPGYRTAAGQYAEVLHRGTWSRVALPADAVWQQIACTAAGHCLAAGSSTTAGLTAFVTISASKATETRGPVVPGATGDDTTEFSGVVCAATTWCVAWGTHQTAGGARAFAEAFDNGVIKTQVLPSSPATSVSETDLDAVVCPNVGVCTGYGNVTSTDDSVHADKLVLDDNVITASPVRVVQDPRGGATQQAGGPATITCTAVGSCVGVQTPGDGSVGFIDTLKSDGWHVRAVPTAAGDSTVYLQSVACTTGEHCYVGASRFPTVSGFPSPRATEIQPDGSEVTLPRPAATASAVAGSATCARGTGFCEQFALYGDYAAGSTYTAFSVAITE